MSELNKLQVATADAMKANDLVWDQRPHWTVVPLAEANGTVGRIPVIDGRLLSTVSGRTEFIGPHTDEARFWSEAMHAAQDGPWDEPR